MPNLDKNLDKLERRDILIKALRSLKNHDGWKIILRVLDANIKMTQEEINGKHGKIESIEKLESLQDKLRDREMIKELPDELIAENQDAESFPPDLDPYE